MANSIYIHRIKALSLTAIDWQEVGDTYVRTLRIETETDYVDVHLFTDGKPGPLAVEEQPPKRETEIWPASRLPTCPKCGWPPMVDEESATGDDPAPIVCAC